MRIMAALRRHHARACLQQRIESGLVEVRPAVAERADRQIDEPRIERGERRIVDAELARAPGPQILDHDIGLARQLVNDVARFRRAEVQRDGAFLLVPPEKAKTKMAERVAFETLD